jgi:hypothetical protein
MGLPNDTQGNICGYGYANDYTILYYPDINDPVSYSPKLAQKGVR